MNQALKCILCSCLVISILAGCSMENASTTNKKASTSTSTTNPIQQNEQDLNKINVQEVSNNSNSSDVPRTVNNVIDKDIIKIGDKIAGLTVKSIERNGRFISVQFSGEVEVAGNCDWEEASEAGAGYVLELGHSEVNKIPQISGQKNRSFIFIKDTDYAKQHLPKKTSKVRVVLNNLLVQNLTAVTNISDLVKVIEVQE